MAISNKNKPELLAPAGDVEAFFAAVEAGADAIYTGYKSFNARQRASNLNEIQLSALVRTARENKIKVFIALNVAIKNNEINELLDSLHVISQLDPDAVIIQEWGVYDVIKTHFPSLTIHASTQMANHNSLGVSFSNKLGIERTIMARELTAGELAAIREKESAEVECFVHGALCYSFSGMCLISSYLGGSGANRGLCTQPCRRQYEVANSQEYLFNLKDNMLIDHLPRLAELGIDCFKIEGRMKPAEYVYKVTSAYRLAIDHPDQLEEARKMLEKDLGREKTSYFMGGNVSDSLASQTATGLYLGKVTKVDASGFSFTSQHELKKGNRVRIYDPNGQSRTAINIKELTREADTCTIACNPGQVNTGDKVFLSAERDRKFSKQFELKGNYIDLKMPANKKMDILEGLQTTNPAPKGVFVRIDRLDWLKKIWIKDIDGLFLRLPKRDWQNLDINKPFIKQNKDKFWIELPGSIPEKDIEFYAGLCKNFFQAGFKKFVISHLSQKLMMPRKAIITCNENVYAFNDLAISFYKKQGLHAFVFPLENDFENLVSSRYKDGLVPVYFHPPLFFSRMPVNTGGLEEMTDDMGNQLIKQVVDGMTIIRPGIPVSLLQYTNQLRKKGFHRFLIDLSGEKVSSNIFKKILKRLEFSEQIQPSSNFNFKRGVK